MRVYLDVYSLSFYMCTVDDFSSALVVVAHSNHFHHELVYNFCLHQKQFKKHGWSSVCMLAYIYYMWNK